MQVLSRKLRYVSHRTDTGLVSFHKSEICLLVICSLIPTLSRHGICIVWDGDEVGISASSLTMGWCLRYDKAFGGCLWILLQIFKLLPLLISWGG